MCGGSLDLSHWRDGAELLHQAKHVELNPLFGKLAVRNAVELIAGKGHLLASRRNAQEVPLMRATPGLANRYLVSFRDEILDGRLQVRKGREEGGRELSERHDPLECGKSGEVRDIVSRKDLVSDAEVLLIHAIFVLAADESLIFSVDTGCAPVNKGGPPFDSARYMVQRIALLAHAAAPENFTVQPTWRPPVRATFHSD